jgi:acetyltransferase-like isoleucine patch superfamily enzyme
MGIFGTPKLRQIRNYFYNKHLQTTGINVDDFVRIGPAHTVKHSFATNIGHSLHISRNAELDTTGGVLLGPRVTISEGAKIFTHDHIIDGGGADWRQNGIKSSPLIIEEDVWIGADAIILQSVNKIGRGAIIASGSVVRNDVEPFHIMAGVPARFIRARRLDITVEN